MKDPKAHRVAFPDKYVIEKLHAKMEAETSNIMLPNIKTDVVYLKYEDSETALRVKMMGASQQTLIDCYTNVVLFEALTTDPASNQVIFQTS